MLYLNSVQSLSRDSRQSLSCNPYKTKKQITYFQHVMAENTHHCFKREDFLDFLQLHVPIGSGVCQGREMSPLVLDSLVELLGWGLAGGSQSVGTSSETIVLPYLSSLLSVSRSHCCSRCPARCFLPFFPTMMDSSPLVLEAQVSCSLCRSL